MKKAFGLSSFNDETKFSGICTEDELIEEAVEIIDEHSLSFVAFTQEDIRVLWGDFGRDDVSPIVTRSVVSSSSWREHYSLGMLCWLYEWYVRWSELKEITKQRPSQKDYLMFFTIRGDIGWLNLKQTSFYECLKYMRRLELGRWQRGTLS